MPELPEVETVRRQLSRELSGMTITSVAILRSGREAPSGVDFEQALLGRMIEAVERRAKVIVWRLNDGNRVLVHLKMTGRLVFVAPDYAPMKHDRIIFACARGEEARTLLWADVRQFGFMKIVSEEAYAVIASAYGPEPLEASVEMLAQRLDRGSSRSLKTALLDQSVIAGIGNIYADEICHRAGVLPTRRLASLSAEERWRLADAMQTVLRESLAQQGTSANDYVDTRGERGGFLEFLRVYQRTGDPCSSCGTKIERIVLAQRSTHYCPHCQS